MKFAFSKRGKLGLVGISIMIGLSVSLYLGMRSETWQERFDRIRVGMTSDESWEILTGGRFQGVEVVPSEALGSFLLPPPLISISFDPKTDRVKQKSIQHPTGREILDYWLWKVGL